MSTQKIQYSEGGDTFDAFLARPEGDGPHPAVMVCHAWGGRDAALGLDPATGDELDGDEA